MLSQYPFKGRKFQTRRGHEMHYLDEGHGTEPPILFLHGNPTWSFMYRRIISELSKNSRCLAPDHIGCGFSEKPDLSDFPYDLENHAENILSLLDYLELSKVSLVLHDWGGAIGLTALRNQPERIHKITLLNTAAFTSPKVPKRILLCRIPLLGSLIVRGLNGFAWPATWMATEKGLDESVKQGFLDPYNNWKNRIAVWRFVQDIPHENDHPSRNLLMETENSLAQLQDKPTIACWGMKDFCFSPFFLNEWCQRMPGLKAHKFHEAGHYILEDAFEEVFPIMRAFLLK